MAPSPHQRERDMQLLLAAHVQLGTRNLDHRMERYVWKRRPDGVYIINLADTYRKLQLAARVLVAIENPQDIIAASSRPYGQRAVFKFGQYLGCKSLAGRFTPGTFTNQIQKNFDEPRVLIVTDPRTDQQPLKESSYVSIPTIAFCDTDSPLEHVDIAIPCNNRGREAIAVMYWMLARMVLEMRGSVDAEHPWDVLPDLFMYREPEEVREPAEEEEAAAAAAAAAGGGFPLPMGAAGEEWGPGGFGAPGAPDELYGRPPIGFEHVPGLEAPSGAFEPVSAVSGFGRTADEWDAVTVTVPPHGAPAGPAEVEVQCESGEGVGGGGTGWGDGAAGAGEGAAADGW